MYVFSATHLVNLGTVLIIEDVIPGVSIILFSSGAKFNLTVMGHITPSGSCIGGCN